MKYRIRSALLAILLVTALLAGLVWLTKLTSPLFEIFDLAISWRDIILMGGGLFLLAVRRTAGARDV